MVTSTIAYICIITDMTDASNTCRRHVINLSSTYKISSLIEEAASFYSYEPSSFYLMWKQERELLNISELNTEIITLRELGLTTPNKNIFEIHERDGPPKKIIIDTHDGDLPNLEPIHYSSIPMASMSRRNASNDLNEYGPVNNSFSNDGVNFNSHYNNSNTDSDNMGYVGLINQAMTCYLNSLLQTLFMTPEFRNGIYRY
jgi:ubiquitin carboxyl-terminal hydrolase 47